MKYLLRSFLIILPLLWVSCKQSAPDNALEGGKSNGENLELSSETESVDPGITSPENGGDLTPLEVKALISENPAVIIVDVRTPEEFESGSVENAINVDIYSPNFLKDIKKLKRGEIYLLYCTVGGRSSAASELMIHEGFTHVLNSNKGFASLKAVGIPIEE